MLNAIYRLPVNELKFLNTKLRLNEIQTDNKNLNVYDLLDATLRFLYLFFSTSRE